MSGPGAGTTREGDESILRTSSIPWLILVVMLLMAALVT